MQEQGEGATPWVSVLGVRVWDLNQAALIAAIQAHILAGEKALIAYLNAHALNLAQELAWFRECLNSAELTYCDGYGVILAARLQGLRLRYRHTPPDWIHALAEECARSGQAWFLLGGRPGVVQMAAATLQQRCPELQICGVQHGYFDKTPGSAENETVLKAIRSSCPRALLTGMGMPLQEAWLWKNWDRLPDCVVLPVGALFDYLSGRRRRSPAWMNAHGLEWLGRLIAEPRRLSRRYLLGNPLLVLRALRARLENEASR